MPLSVKDLYRHGLKVKEITNVLGKPPTSNIVEGGNTHHQSHLSSQRAGKQALSGLISIGGEKHDKGPDVLQYIKKIDPQNSSGAVKEALDIMLKLQKSTEAGDLHTSIQPLQNILGSLYGAFQKSGSAAKTGSKTQKKKQTDEQTQEETQTGTEDIIAALIAAAMEKLTPDEAAEAAELLDQTEIDKISQAFFNGGVYVSTVEIGPFVAAINELMPIFRKIAIAGAAVS